MVPHLEVFVLQTDGQEAPSFRGGSRNLSKGGPVTLGAERWGVGGGRGHDSARSAEAQAELFVMKKLVFNGHQA